MTILQALADQARLFVVRWRGAPVAAGLVIGDRGRLEIPWASSLREANAIGVNMLLYWSVLEYACERQYAAFDFGRSTVDAGTYRFKKQWGAQPRQLYWHYWLRAGGAAACDQPLESEVSAGDRGVAAPAARRGQSPGAAAGTESAVNARRARGFRESRRRQPHAPVGTYAIRRSPGQSGRSQEERNLPCAES